MESNNTQNGPKSAEAPVTPTPTLTFHKQNADAFIATLDAFVATLVKAEKVDPGKARAAVAVPLPFIAAAVAQVEQSVEARKYIGIDVAAAQDGLQYYDAYITVYNRVLRLVSELKQNLDAHRTELAFQSLQIYATVKRLVRRQGATGKVEFQIMQKELKRKRRAKAEEETPATTTSPVNPGTAPPAGPQPQKQK